MLFKPKEYLKPTSIDEAVSFLAKYGEKAIPLAGGTDILVDKPSDIEYVVDITGLSLDYIKDGKEGVRIGALSTFHSIETSELLGKGPNSILAEAAREMGSTAIRNVATVGGNICNAVPSAELPPALIVLGAKVKIVGANGERVLPLEDFLKGVRKTDLRTGEIVTEIQVPRPPSRTGTAFLNIGRVSVDMSTVIVAVRLTVGTNGACREARIAIGGGVGPTCLLSKACKLLQDKKIGDALIDKVALTISGELKPRPTSIRGSPFLKKGVTKVLVKRAIKQAFEKARGER
ncbi:MAG: xanthine dehydrogenase family protein subunit M [Candidatus Bathyarchaeota archaeon]|nr:xanthine dehydrogenase family protein subunit M [Candidatus Bathyarchaeota archaeon]